MTDLRRLAAPAYVLALALILVPLADVAISLFPWRFMDPRWRFGAAGVASNALLLPLAGVFLALAAAVTADHRPARKIIGVAAVIGAVLSLLGLIVFALDAVQTRSAVRLEMRAGFATAAIGAAFKMVASGAVLVALARTGLAKSAVKVSTPRDIPLITRTAIRPQGDA